MDTGKNISPKNTHIRLDLTIKADLHNPHA